MIIINTIREKLIKLVKIENSIKEIYIQLMLLEIESKANSLEYQRNINILQEAFMIETKYLKEIKEKYNFNEYYYLNNNPVKYAVSEYVKKDDYFINNSDIETNPVYIRIINGLYTVLFEDKIKDFLNNNTYDDTIWINEACHNYYISDKCYLFIEELDKEINSYKLKENNTENNEIITELICNKYKELFKYYQIRNIILKEEYHLKKPNLYPIFESYNIVNNSYINIGENSINDILYTLCDVMDKYSDKKIKNNHTSAIRNLIIYGCHLKAEIRLLDNKEKVEEYITTLLTQLYYGNYYNMENSKISSEYFRNCLINLVSKFDKMKTLKK